MRAVSIACALVLATISARAQDPATVDANHYKVLIDNERTRVFRVVVGPGERVPIHEHPDAIMIPLSTPAPADGPTKAAAAFLRAQKHGGDNPGTTPIDFIYIELKRDAPTTATLPLNRPGAITGTRLVEHPKADAILVTAATGAGEPYGATHDYDEVIVALGDAELSLTIDGKTTNTWRRGDVAFIGRNVRHGSKHNGKPADFVIVAIK